MSNLRLLPFLLGSLALLTSANKNLEQIPESLVRYRDPETSVGLKTSFTLDRSLSQLDPEATSSTLSFIPSRDETFLLPTADTTSAPASATTDASVDEELIVLRIVTDVPENERLRRRDIGGFIGSQSGICDNADLFTLLDGQLLVGGNPVYYNGEEFKVLSSPGRTPSGAITRTFTRDGNKLRFQSSRFPTGEAGFCQTPSDGQVYITFSSEPAGCIPVTILVVSFSTSSSVEATEVSTAESTESTNKSSTQIDELTSTTKDATTSTFQTTTLANSQTTTESAAGETTVDTTTEGSTTDIPTTTAEESTTDIPTSIDVESTTNIPTTSADESTSEIPITTTLSSALDSTTETTTEAATTTTAEAVPQVICPSNPQQCFNTMLIYCETVVGGIPLSPGTFSAQECFEKCYLDAACVIWTHSGTQCFLTNNLSDNQGQFGIQGWTSGIKGQC
ncbi:uncharacterized protein QYS62_003199 [Fusarium acuminatum]|uniref:DUF7908 domain-containing protein n=1 Tax=Fusarium acuminatum TaxID=5515 RepID=A0ABZ2WQY9_9HYPO